MTTLTSTESSPYFSTLLADRWNFQQHNTGTDEIFIDQDPEYFGVLLYLLRIGDLHMPKSISKDLLTKKLDCTATRATFKRQ
ncbi:hypothetical protein CDL15_Pgr002373 [Punica granatum]|uniref:Potassium channel tetramerisation-type BTB domain-containing protein n=1 Tax=Punica granatum TaxID=22663 RepID=A0A218XVE0_PUNGR|nr:hypothetical protein CDL15_Pgr002373 [Punica granatum]PKI37703.1 hypothetical protein CRG98_041996 [Punica granatum]